MSQRDSRLFYGLSPMQAGMLFETLRGEGSGLREGSDIEQLHVVLPEVVDEARLARAFTHVVERHEALSSAFEWEDGPPRQSATFDLAVNVTREDWRGVTGDERARRREQFLVRDRAKGFDLAKPPLMRIAVFPVDAETTEVIWTFHHILMDGRSIAPVFAEAFAAYDAIERGERLSQIRPARPYRAYIDWLAQRDPAPSKSYFREHLRGKGAPTPLPLAEPAARPLLQKGTREVRRTLDPRTATALRDLAQRCEVTTGAIVHAAWALVLARTTGEDDVLFGSTRSGRRGPLGTVSDETVGLFINTAPMRVSVADDRRVEELLTSVREASFALRNHVHTSLTDVQGVSEIPRGTPLFETLIMFDTRELDASLRASGDPRWSAVHAELHEQPAVPLTVLAFDTGELFDLRLLYDRTRYRDAVPARLVEYLAKAMEELSHGEGRRLGEIDVLPADERRRVLTEWNATGRPYVPTLIHAGFEARARQQPGAIAVECDDASITYAELDARANRLAHALVARGAKPGCYVGVCLRRSIDLVVALLAVAKSGAPYVPLDPEYPIARLGFMVEDSGACVVVTEVEHRPLFKDPVLVVDGEDRAAIEAMPSTAPARTAGVKDDCYAIYTSGSTGTPKGVVLTHDAVVNTFEWVTRTLEVAPGDRLLFVTSPCFDLSVYDTFGSLAAGATVVVATTALLEDAEVLARAVVDRAITIWDSAPAALQRLVPFFPKSARKAPLRLVMLSGDWIPIGLPDAMRAAFAPSLRITSLGGATEAAIWSNWFSVGAIDPRWTSVPYGRPIQNARYHILDAHMRPVPTGAAGDLYIGGTCLARGYLNRAELTAERFVKDPFASAPGERLYKTGDLARYFDDGELEFLGRADFQVKIRGFRVELGEVEAALLALGSVRETVCTAHKDASGQKSLVAYVVLREGASATAESIKGELASKLTDFMVPTHVVFLAAMPLSSNGKVDRKALPDPSASVAVELVPPRTELERKLLEIWVSVLGTDRIGVTDNFFALGGHSLLVVLLVTRIDRDVGAKVRLSTVLDHPTIAGLADYIEENGATTLRGGHVTTLAKGTSRPPLVFVAGSGGFGFVFRGMAQFLQGEHDVHVLHAIGAESELEGLDHSIEEMAAIYLPEVLAYAPRGPLVLGGYSFGILVAFELARRMRESGRDIPLLISFDGFGPRYPELLPLPERLVEHARAIFGHGDPAARRAYARDRLTSMRNRVRGLLGRKEAEEAMSATDRRLKRLEAALWRARGAYDPHHATSADLLLIKTSIPERWPGSHMDDPYYGWKRYTRGRIDVSTVPGDHRTLFEEGNQRQIAEAILRATGPLKRREP